MTDLTFTSWQRTRLYDLVDDATRQDGRLVGRLRLDLADRRGPDTATGTVPFSLAAPRDVAALVGAVTRTAPANLARDAETTKLVHAEFRAPDLPWRYTPATAAGDRLAPWLVVLVGTTEELRVDGTTATVLRRSVLDAHDLADSPRWAHVQDDGHTRVARVLSPRPLAPLTDYAAVVVPAFDAAGEPAWGPGTQPATLPVLHAWRFRTGEEGDFETLAFAIMPRSAAGLGRAPLAYDRGDVHAGLQIRGAITTLGGDPDGEPEATARADLAALVGQVRALADPLGRGVLALPVNGPPWADPAAATWAATLDADPRHRGVAGLGRWMGLEAQDELVDAATRQLGALELAGHLVSELALGLTAARSLWDRRLPADPVARLDLLSPLLGRLRTPTGTALGALTGPASPLEPALFSSASRRALRRGTARTRYGTVGGRPAVLTEANRCPPPPDRPRGLPHADAVAAELGLRPLAELGGRIVRDPPRLDPDARLDPPAALAALLPLLPATDRPCAPPDLDRAGAAVAGAVDPPGPRPPAVRRVAGRVSGIDAGDLRPPELPVGLDLPTWTLLRDRAPQWVLPGVGTLAENSVVAMQTNPTFVAGYLVGLNAQLLGELHWRNRPVERAGSPLRMFWGHVDFATGQREAEIRPIADWDPTGDLGDLAHQVPHPGDPTGTRDLVLVFRTDLFRRYPRTVVYLARPTPTAADALRATPSFGYAPADKATRRFLGPVFQGALGPDLVFFGFDVDPATLDQYWLVLDEPPSELRFRAVDAAGNPVGGAAATAADLATATIDRPTRVGIDGAHLEQLGLHP